MVLNKVVEILLKEVGTDHLQFISGEISNPGEKGCGLTDERGSVYGIAVELLPKDKEDFLKNNNDKNVSKEKWISIGDNYYPLYWGKDINMGARLHSHTKTSESTGTIYLNQRSGLIKKNVIYGAVPCSNYADVEKRLHEKYPDIYKTCKKVNQEELFIADLSLDD